MMMPLSLSLSLSARSNQIPLHTSLEQIEAHAGIKAAIGSWRGNYYLLEDAGRNVSEEKREKGGRQTREIALRCCTAKTLYFVRTAAETPAAFPSFRVFRSSGRFAPATFRENI